MWFLQVKQLARLKFFEKQFSSLYQNIENMQRLQKTSEGF